MKLGWAFLISAWLLLLASFPEGPQQGYILFGMLLCIAAAVITLAVVWLWKKLRRPM